MTQVTNYEAPAGGTGLATRTAINAILLALRDANAGNTAPPNPVAGMLWRDTSASPHVMRIRNSTNTAWVALLADMGVVLGNAAGNVPVLVGAGGLLEAARIPNGVGARLIRTVNIPSAVASVDFTSADMNTSLFSDFIFVLRNVVPVTNGARLWLRTSADGGATFAAGAGAYAHANTGSNSSPNSGANGATSATEIQLTFGATSNASGVGISGDVTIMGCDVAARQKMKFQTSHWRGDLALFENTIGGAIRLADATINGARFMFSSGNIAGSANSSISIYGVAK